MTHAETFATSVPPPKPDDELVKRLVLANRILYDKGVVDGFGHVSVRHNKAPGYFLLSRSKAPALVTEEDILVHDCEGNTGDGQKQIPLYLERYIHSEIYKARPDVMSVVHSHNKGAVLLGVTGQRLRPICHVAGFLGSGSRHFDIADAVGDSDLLIVNNTLGRSLANELNESSCVLMRGHGMTVVGDSIEEAVYRAIYAEANAQLQITASLIGTPRFLTEGEAARTTATQKRAGHRAWDLWCDEMRRSIQQPKEKI